MATGKSTEYKMAIVISGKVDRSLDSSIGLAQGKLAGFKAGVSALDKQFVALDKTYGKIEKGMASVLKGMATVAVGTTAALTGTALAATEVGKKFEDAFAGVKKTVEATSDEFAMLRKNVIDMSKEIPSTADEIAGAMEKAGQLGIEVPDLTGFTRAAINMGVATNLDSETAGDVFARIANITGMKGTDAKGISNYERMGSTIVDLGNKFATNEDEIANMALNLSAVGSNAGLTVDQILALSTAMTSLNIRAEKGGSAMSKMIKKLQIAAETGSGSLDKYAKVAGMTPEEFQKKFKTNAIEPITEFIKGLSNTERNGASTAVVMNDLGLKEVRLSDVLTRLTNSQDNFNRALDTAKTAWEQNVALQEEVDKRNETFGSRLQILKNRVTALGIALYDNSTRTPFLTLIEKASDGIAKLESGGMQKIFDKINETMPTIQRVAKTIWRDAQPLLNGMLKVGKWFVDHPDAIVGTFVGIGSALATYKIASTLTHIVAAVTALGPAGLAIVGTTAAVGAIAGHIAATRIELEKMAATDMAERFGDITLSMEDLDAVARRIVDNGTIDAVQDALSNFDNAEPYAASIDEAVKSINRMNWKVSIGVQLSDEDQSSYKNQIDAFIKNSQEYVTSTQQAVEINMRLGLGDYAGTDNVIAATNQVFTDAYTQMQSLGEDLAKAVNDAFSDEILDPDEITRMSEIMGKMAEIKEKLATSNYQAELQMISEDFTGKELTSDSVLNLMQRISETQQKAQEAYDQSYVYNLSALGSTYAKGTPEYNNAAKALRDNRLTTQAQYAANAAEALTGVLGGNYAGSLLNKATSVIDPQALSGQISAGSAGSYYAGLVTELQRDKGMKALEKEIEEFVTQMEPTIDSLRTINDQLKASGLGNSDEAKRVQNALSTIKLYQGISSGSGAAMMQLLGQGIQKVGMGDAALANTVDGQVVGGTELVKGIKIAENAEAMQSLTENGGTITETIAKGAQDSVGENVQKYIVPAVDDLYTQTQQSLNDRFSSDPMHIDWNLVLSSPSMRIDALNGNLKHNAEGGIWNHPILTTFAENGTEAAIPWDGSQRAKNLWEQTGYALGTLSRDWDNSNALNNLGSAWSEPAGTGRETTIEFSPQIVIQGNASREDVQTALHMSMEEFKAMYQQMMADGSRVAFT